MFRPVQAFIAPPLLLGLNACAGLLQREAPSVPAPFSLSEPIQSASIPGLLVQATVLGPGQPLVAARNLVGGVSRVVNPFGARKLLVHIRASAAAGAQLNPSEARLQFDGQAGLAPHSLDDFRRRWPTWALRSAQEAEDQRLAYEAILDRLWLERRLGVAEMAEGVLAFPIRPLHRNLRLVWPVQAGGIPGTLSWSWVLR